MCIVLNMKWKLFIVGLLYVTEPSLADGRALGDLFQCYTNQEYFDRELRPTMTMENLIYIIRKIEMHPASTYVDIRQLVFTLLQRYRKDGFQKIINENSQINIIQKKEDRRALGLLQKLSTDLNNPSFNEIPAGVLKMEEECALHWMLSHTVDDTRRADEETLSKKRFYRAHSVAKRQIMENRFNEENQGYPTSKRPIEMGVIYSKVGGVVSGGHLLTGIALGLENKAVPLESVYPYLISDEMKGKMIEPLYAATLAGEIGEGAIVEGSWIALKSKQVVGPSGKWSDDCCPREYILDGPRTSVTTAEIHGAVDGLLIGTEIQEYSKKGARLSQVLQMYYNERGMAHNLDVKACDRSRIFNQEINKGKLDTQARNYAYLFASMYKDSLTLPMVQEAPITAIDRYVGTVTGEAQAVLDRGAGTDYESCKISSQTTNVRTMPSENYYDFYFILDTYVTSEDEIQQMKDKVRDLLSVHDIGLFKTRVAIFIGRASSLETVSHFNNPPDGYNALCKLMVHQTGVSNAALVPKDIISKMSTIVESDINYEKRNELGGTNGKVLVLLSPRSKFKDPRSHKTEFDNFYFSYPDFNITILTGNTDYKQLISEKYVMKYETTADQFAKHLESVPERLIYPNCRYGEKEDTHEHKIYVSPMRIKFIAYSGRWFGESSKFNIRLATSSKVIRVCVSRFIPRPVEPMQNWVWCQETREGQQAVDVRIDNPCDRWSCRSVFMSVVNKDSNSKDDVICVEPGCNYIDQTEVTITHSGMRCGSSAITTATWLVVLALIVTKFREYIL